LLVSLVLQLPVFSHGEWRASGRSEVIMALKRVIKESYHQITEVELNANDGQVVIKCQRTKGK